MIAAANKSRKIINSILIQYSKLPSLYYSTQSNVSNKFILGKPSWSINKEISLKSTPITIQKLEYIAYLSKLKITNEENNDENNNNDNDNININIKIDNNNNKIDNCNDKFDIFTSKFGNQDKLREDIGYLVNFVDTLTKAQIDNVSPLIQPYENEIVLTLRDDIIGSEFPIDSQTILSNSKCAYGIYFSAPNKN
eukprot:TRINITY_DN2808_c0_g1_i3.p1 TRINITY_DN2808_c0_g1~~TRINITY_DN2808_c0_g1_i3.p1  ORF type:complete len:211 (+),score=100.89 TRINITY_DN2808_c0_g1_i3:50-634(+)